MSTEFRVLVCGGRDYADKAKVYQTLDGFLSDNPSVLHIIHGAARGADSLASQWAKDRGVTEIAYPADWKAYGKQAGYIRNKQMLDEGKPDLVLAFPGGAGTAMMVRIARAARVKTIEY
jgi:predicted dinucleotide-utilizing enzyme